MVGCHERVIFVNATPRTASSVPTLTFNLEDEGHGGFQSSANVITQVGDVIVQHCVLKIEFVCRQMRRSAFFLFSMRCVSYLQFMFYKIQKFLGHKNIGIYS